MQKIGYNKVIMLLAFSILLAGFFWCVYIPYGFCKIISFASELLLLILCAKTLLDGKINFFIPVLLLVAMSLMTFITAFVFHGQSIILSLRVILPWMQICFCFLLLFYKVNEKEIYIFILLFITLYIVLYLSAVAVAPELLFDPSNKNEYLLDLSRGWYRIKIVDHGLVLLMLFWQLNLYASKKKKINLCLATICFLVKMLSLSRQHMVIAVTMSVLFLLNRQRWYYKLLFIGVIMLLFYYVIPHFAIYQKLMGLTEQQMLEDGIRNNVRYMAYQYYLTCNTNVFQDLFGNGLFHSESNYGMSIYRIMFNRGLILADVGMAGFWFYFGLIGCVSIAYFCYNLLFFNYDKEHVFIKYYIISILLGTILSHEFDSSLIGISIAYYLMYIQYREKRDKLLYISAFFNIIHNKQHIIKKKEV